MSLYDSFLNLKFDKRMKTWNLTQGLVTEKEIKEDLENLTDVTENAEPMVLFPSPSEPKNTDQSPSQEQEAPQTQQEPPLTNEKDDTAYNTQPPVAIDQDSLQQQEQIATEEKTAVNKDENTQKTNEDPSNPWW